MKPWLFWPLLLFGITGYAWCWVAIASNGEVWPL